MTVVFRIRDWSEHFENNRTKDLKAMTWVRVPNKLDGDGYTELLDHNDGAAHYGAWMAMVHVASKCNPRGTLLRDGAKPHDSRSLSRITRIPAEVFDAAIPRLIEIGWLECIPLQNEGVTEIPQETAVAPQEGAGSRRESAAYRNGTGGEESRKEPEKSTKRARRSGSGVFVRISKETLRSTNRLRSWFEWQAQQPRPVAPATDEWFQRLLSMAEHCLLVGRNPVAMFARNVGKGDWQFGSDTADDRGKDRFMRWKRESAGRLRPELEAALAAVKSPD